MITGNPPSTRSDEINYIITEEWLDNVLTTTNTNQIPGTPNALIDSDTHGKIADGWLASTKKKVTTSSENYDSNASGYYVKVGVNSTLDHSLLNLYHNTNSPILNLDSNNQIPISLIPSDTSGGTGNILVKTNEDGKIDDSFIRTTNDKLSNTIVTTDEDGYLKRSLFDITRIVRVISANIDNTTTYTINNASQNSNTNTNQTLTIPTNRNDLYVFHNGQLLADNVDYSVTNLGVFTFNNGLSVGDILQIIAMN